MAATTDSDEDGRTRPGPSAGAGADFVIGVHAVRAVPAGAVEPEWTRTAPGDTRGSAAWWRARG
ncbi:hypothetical protein ACE14D_23655, partial [Streptomyces sp. Act-28]